jgi:hypothetical protein
VRKGEEIIPRVVKPRPNALLAKQAEDKAADLKGLGMFSSFGGTNCLVAGVNVR